MVSGERYKIMTLEGDYDPDAGIDDIKIAEQSRVFMRSAKSTRCACDRTGSIILGEKGVRIRFCRNFDNMLKESRGEIGRDILEFYNNNPGLVGLGATEIEQAIKETLANPKKANPEVLKLMLSMGITDMKTILANDIGKEGLGAIAGVRLFTDAFDNISGEVKIDGKTQNIKDIFLDFYTAIVLARYSQSLAITEGIMDMMNQASHIKLFCKVSKAVELINGTINKLVRKKETLSDRLKFYGADISSIKGRQMLLSAMKANRAMCEYAEKPATGAVGAEFACKRFDEMLREIPYDFGLDALHAYGCHDFGKKPGEPYDPNKLNADSTQVLAYFMRIFADPRSIKKPPEDKPKEEWTVEEWAYKYIKYLGYLNVEHMHYILDSKKKTAEKYRGEVLNGAGIVAIHRVIHDLWKDAWATNKPDPAYFLDRPAPLYVMRLYLLALLAQYRIFLTSFRRILEERGKESALNIGVFKAGVLARALTVIDLEIVRMEEQGVSLVKGFEKAEALRAKKLAAIQGK